VSTTGNWKYQEKLLDRKHVELSKEVAEMLNEDWRLRPPMNFFAHSFLVEASSFKT
jgi:hypothetical protein